MRRDGVGETDRDRQTDMGELGERKERRDRRQSEKDVGGTQELEAKAGKRNMTINQRERQKKRKKILTLIFSRK